MSGNEDKMVIDTLDKEDTKKGIKRGGDLVIGRCEFDVDNMILDENGEVFGRKMENEGFLSADCVTMDGLNRFKVGDEKKYSKETKEGDDSVLDRDLPKPHFIRKHQEKEVENLGVDVLSKVPGEDLAFAGAYADPMNVDISHAKALKQSQAVKPLKRKRTRADVSVIYKDKESLASECQQELGKLYEYYKEFLGHKLNFGENIGSSKNSLIVCLIEESNLPFSKLVEEVFEKLKGREEVTLASVRSAVLAIGQRMMYGISNADADVLEDESPSCLWCWEVRDMKLLRKSLRGILNVRRIGRRKIHERISALAATLSALSTQESRENYKTDLIKASGKLGKALNVEGIRLLVETLKQKNEAEMSVKECQQKEKESVKQTERNTRNAEKESKRIEQEIQKEKSQSEKDLKWLQEEAGKEERNREKEQLEQKKQLKKQQDEAERDQKRREKADAEIKRQRAIQKQASIMHQFLKRRKCNNELDDMGKGLPVKEPMPSSAHKEVVAVNATTSAMDGIFSQQGSHVKEELHCLHVASWRKLSHRNRSSRWGVRHEPKTGLFKELKLQGSSEVDPLEKVETANMEVASYKVNFTSEPSLYKPVEGTEECSQIDLSMATQSITMLCKKLLQFDKSHRPAYYGAWQTKSGVIGPRRPFNKDPNLDYDVDSDEEWEEEEPGESLSDCDKDNEDDDLEEKGSKLGDEEDDTEDDFVVPDGYLSENEGAQVDDAEDCLEDENRSTPNCKPEAESEEIKLMLQQQKYLQNFTDQSLRKSHPLVISNLMHERSGKKMAEELDGATKAEQICLQVLSMQSCSGGSVILISVDQSTSSENHEVLRAKADNTTSTVTASTILDSDLSAFVLTIRSNPYGIDKVVKSLQPKFPNIPKCHIRNKIRELSNFVDNRWQVKKEVLKKLGLSTSPDIARRPKGISSFFTKRCLPPEDKDINVSVTSQPCSKSEPLHDDEGHCSYIG